MKQLIYNAIRCPDGTLLQSRHRHDFRIHVQDDGREYFVDGGLEYQRIGYSDNDYTDLTVYAEDEHYKIRDVFTWTRCFDKDMQPLPKPEFILLKNITDSHLEALVEFTKTGYPAYINKIFNDEMGWRKHVGNN